MNILNLDNEKTIPLYFFFLLVFGCINISLNAQSEVFFSIQKEEIGEEEWVRIFITNDTITDLALFCAASWDHRGLTYLRHPSSYIRFIGNPNDSATRYETHQIVLSKTTMNKIIHQIPNMIMQPGETRTEMYQLIRRGISSHPHI